MRVLITGSNGFIGSNLCEFLSKDFNIFKGTRKTIDLYSRDSVKKFLNENEIESIIHCAIEGGKRTIEDSSDVVYRNLLMAENLLSCIDGEQNRFINIASGAEFDRKRNISNTDESDIYTNIPTDYYGLSKNIISKLVRQHLGVNIRIFGCFYYNELNTRFIKHNIINSINRKPMIIHQDKFMDFFYMEDLVEIVKYFLTYSDITPYDTNLSYFKKYKLSDIASLINDLSFSKVDIIIENNIPGLDYTGRSDAIEHLSDFIKLKGLETGIKECYSKIYEC